MLVCSVSLRPQRHTIAADVVEVADAIDVSALSAIYATLSDAPGNALDILVAFVGQNMAEAASATATANAGSAYSAEMVEASVVVTAQDASIATSAVRRDGMIDGTQVNSDGTARQANAGGTMVNL